MFAEARKKKSVAERIGLFLLADSARLIGAGYRRAGE